MEKQRPIFVSTLIILTLSIIFLFAGPARAAEPAGATLLPGRLIIPAIDLDSAVVPVSLNRIQRNGKTYGVWQVAQNEVGWHDLSAYPGQIGNTVMAGHSDIFTRVFRNLEDIELGDEIMSVSAATGETHRYRVTHKFLLLEKGVSEEIRLKNARWIMPTQDERLTLVTCAKPGATHRLIVVARPVPND